MMMGGGMMGGSSPSPHVLNQFNPLPMINGNSN